MGIDTRAKRQSAAWVGYPGPPSILPTGEISRASRQQVSWTYRGILTGSTAEAEALRNCVFLIWTAGTPDVFHPGPTGCGGSHWR